MTTVNEPTPSEPLHDDGADPAVDPVEQFVTWVVMMVHDLESVPDETSKQKWCVQWWDHPEAVSRLSALYEAYVKAEEEQNLSAWWLQHWDAHARVLLSQDGPFKKCQGRHRFFEDAKEYRPRLTAVAPPEGWAP